MSALKGNSHQSTYKAASLTLVLFGTLYLFDRIISFSSLGLPWVMQKEHFLLYTAIVFLLFNSDKTVGIVLAGLWLILNFSLVATWIGFFSTYLLPLILLLAGGILYWLSTR